MPEITCKTCGVVFSVSPCVAKTGKGKYCSRKCSGISKRKEKIERICQYCNNKFLVFPCKIKDKRGKYCSRECHYKAIKGRPLTEEKKLKIKKGENNHLWRGGKTERICQTCGKTFLAKHGVEKFGRGKYCNRSCYDKSRTFRKNSEETRKKMSLSNRGKPKYGLRGAKCHFWKGGITELRQKIRSSIEYKNWRTKIFLRDDFTCLECHSRGGYLEAHHRKPFSVLVQEAKNAMPLFDPYVACILYTPMWDISNGKTLCSKCHEKTKGYFIYK